MKACSVERRTRLGTAVLAASGCLVSLLLFTFPGIASAEITLTITGGTGAPGGTATVTFAMSGDDSNQAVGVSDFVSFSSVLSVSNADCQLDPRIPANSHIKNVASLCIPSPPPGTACVLVDIAVNPALADPYQPLGNGNLMTCTFHIDGSATPGPLALTASQKDLQVGDKDLNLLPATVVSGEIIVSAVTPTPTTTETPEATTTATHTLPPTATPTHTLPPPTATPTNTLPPTATATKTLPPATATPTNTLPPTATPTNTLPPTRTPTNTPPPTSTPTRTPTVHCVVDQNCPPGQICLNQVCSVEQCSDSQPCPGGRQCVSGVCQQLPAPTSTPGGGGGGGGGCSTVLPDGQRGSLLWLLIPIALVAWRRRAAG